jgi:peptide/nickel transport system permease protein
MFAFVLRRLVQAVLVMLTVAFIAFMLFQYVGDPVTNILGQDATPQQRQQLRADLGLDSPFPVQFARFVATPSAASSASACARDARSRR